MLSLGVDIGGSTRNGITLMESGTEKIVKCSYIPYDSNTNWEHRNKVLDEILHNYIEKYPVDFMLFEAVNLYRGGRVSPLANIKSLTKIQTKFIDNLSDKLDIYDTDVQAWKSSILGNRYATKYDSLRFVEAYYPEVDLKAVVHYKRKPDEYEDNHDLADSVCIALYGCRHPEKLTKKLNYT